MAQLDNATDSDSGEREFKSLRAGHFDRNTVSAVFLLYYYRFLRKATNPGSAFSQMIDLDKTITRKFPEEAQNLTDCIVNVKEIARF